METNIKINFKWFPPKDYSVILDEHKQMLNIYAKKTIFERLIYENVNYGNLKLSVYIEAENETIEYNGFFTVKNE